MILLASAPPAILLAQNSREDWVHLRNRVDFERYLAHSLEDAPLTAEERVQIYTLIDSGPIHDSFRDDQPEEERRLVLSTRIGFIALGHDDRQQILVRGPQPFCGASGNCALWVFMRQSGEARLILKGVGKSVLAGRGVSDGFTDLVIPFHDSASETSFTVHRWSHLGYKPIDCYVAILDLFHPEKAATIHNCPAPM